MENNVASDSSSRSNNARPPPVGPHSNTDTSNTQSYNTGHSQDALPPGWEMRQDIYGRNYYIDHNTRSTTWQRPQPLPNGWQAMLDSAGRVYYIDHINGMTTWQRPNDERLHLYQLWRDARAQFIGQSNSMDTASGQRFLQSDSENPQTARQMGNSRNPPAQQDNPITQETDEEDLPRGWEAKQTRDGKKYFVNHISKTSQWEDPRTQRQIDEEETEEEGKEEEKKIKRSFSWKWNQLKFLCRTNSIRGETDIRVRRQSLFQDSFDSFSVVPSHYLRKKLYVSFANEEAIDYGGVTREWFVLLSHEILNPMYCLFEYTKRNNYTVEISPLSHINPNHLHYFKFIGKFIAAAIFHGHLIQSGFTLPFYKRLLNKQLTEQDVESIDPEFYNSIIWIRDNNIDCSDLELFFNMDFEVLGQVIHHQLVEKGDDIRVTEQNKDQYLKLLTEWRMKRGTEAQMTEFMEGFMEVLPLQWLGYFNEGELEILLCGMEEVDVDDWEQHTVYKGYVRNSKQIIWFWQFVRSSKLERRMRLIQFVTGTCRVPIGGFSQLVGINGLQRFCIDRAGKVSGLPTSHTCVNRLDLPPYKNYQTLSKKLIYAIEETEGFGQQ